MRCERRDCFTARIAAAQATTGLSGWAAFTGEDPDGIEATSVVIMCPVCAAREFEWRPEAADGYV